MFDFVNGEAGTGCFYVRLPKREGCVFARFQSQFNTSEQARLFVSPFTFEGDVANLHE